MVMIVLLLLCLIVQLLSMSTVHGYQPSLQTTIKPYTTGTKTAPIIVNRVNDPRLRRFNPYRENVTNNTLNTTAGDAQERPQYYLPRTRSATHEIAKYRHEGNYYQAQPLIAGGGGAISALAYFAQPPAIFSSQVLHTEPWTTALPPIYADYRNRRAAAARSNATITPIAKLQYQDRPVRSIGHEQEREDVDDLDNAVVQLRDVHRRQDAAEYDDTAELSTERPSDLTTLQPIHEIRSFHDIFMRLGGPHDHNLYGHVEHGPHLDAQRFESQHKGNRFKGEIRWADRAGGYGAHSWDLAQGKL